MENGLVELDVRRKEPTFANVECSGHIASYISQLIHISYDLIEYVLWVV